MARRLAGNIGEISVVDVVIGLAEGLPTGLYHNRGIEHYVAQRALRPRPHQRLPPARPRALPIATDLDTTERIVLGEGEWADVPISKRRRRLGRAADRLRAGRARGAPADRRRHPLDHQRRRRGRARARSSSSSSTRWSPTSTTSEARSRPIFGSRVRRVSDMGMPAIGNQAFRLLAHARLHLRGRVWEERYPGVDIILIEPELDDELMFGTSILDYSARLQIAKHGFESVTLKLARDYDRYKAIAERHGIEISARRVRHVLDRSRRRRRDLRLAPGARADDRRAAAPVRPARGRRIGRDE